MYKFKEGDVVKVTHRDEHDDLRVGDVCEVLEECKAPEIRRISDGVSNYMNEDELELLTESSVVVKSVVSPSYSVSIPGVEEFVLTQEQAHQLQITLESMLN